MLNAIQHSWILMEEEAILEILLKYEIGLIFYA
jgi:hypothetical protein